MKAKKLIIFSLMILLSLSLLLVGCGVPEDYEEFESNGQKEGINPSQGEVNPFDEGQPAPSPGMGF